MIKLTRDRTTTKIPSGLQGAARIKKNLAVLKLKRELKDIPSTNFKSNLWKPAKKQLRVESNNKCAYCEADTKVVAHGDVEHFRPKNVYWWLAYCYDNYLYSCQICNQTFKSNKFTISGNALKGPKVTSRTSDARLTTFSETMTPDPVDSGSVTAFTKLAIAENADLIDPYIQDPEDWLVWEVDDVVKEVSVKVKPRAKARAAKQKAINEIYGLNREELCKVRYLDYKTAKVFKLSLEALEPLGETETVNEIKAEFKRLMADEHRFAGMMRYFVNKKWKLDLED